MGEDIWRVLAGALSPQPGLSPQVAASAFSPPPWPTAPTSLAARPRWAATREAGAGRRWPRGRPAGMLLGGRQRPWRLPSPRNANRLARSCFSEVWPSGPGGRAPRAGDPAPAHGPVARSPGVQRPPVRPGAAQRPRAPRLRRHGGRARAAGGTAPPADGAGRERRHVGGRGAGPGRGWGRGEKGTLEEPGLWRGGRPAFKPAHAVDWFCSRLLSLQTFLLSTIRRAR